MSTNDHVAPLPPQDQPIPVGNEDAPSKLTPKQELYCVTLVETGNQPFSYRRAYDVSPTIKPATVWKECVRLGQNPHVRARIKELLDEAASKTTVSKSRLIQFLWDRIMADRRQLVNHVRRCCRHCWGEGHRYQWKDEYEFAMALAKTMDFNGQLDNDDPRRKELPNMDGGIGFDPHREPEPTCDSPECMGDGFGKTVLADTTQLSGDAALIYEGVKETAQGIEMKVADRNADMVMLSKLLGWSVEKTDATINASVNAAGLPVDVYDIPSTVSSEEASKRYLSLVTA